MGGTRAFLLFGYRSITADKGLNKMSLLTRFNLQNHTYYSFILFRPQKCSTACSKVVWIIVAFEEHTPRMIVELMQYVTHSRLNLPSCVNMKLQH
jgi:hypothetical protein